MRYKGLTLRVLGRRGPLIGPGKAELVERIAASGSISAAAREMGMSYRRAWQLVESLNAAFREPVVTTAIGGRRGGGARVTAFGKQVVREYRRLEDKASTAIAPGLKRYQRYIP